MPPLMRGYLSELQDEWGSAAQDLHEVKEEAITDIHSEREKVLKEMQDESQTSYEDFKEKMETLKDDLFVDLADKFTEFEETSKPRINASPPQSTRDPKDAKLAEAGGKNSAQEAARVFQHYHQGHLTIEQKVKVLLSIAKWNNADVFMAAGRDMQEALVKHWAGVTDYASNSAPIFL